MSEELYPKAYIVIEEYDPYLHDNCESMVQREIHAVCSNSECARLIRNKIADREAREYDVNSYLNSRSLASWKSQIELLGSTYYIIEEPLLSDQDQFEICDGCCGNKEEKL